MRIILLRVLPIIVANKLKGVGVEQGQTFIRVKRENGNSCNLHDFSKKQKRYFIEELENWLNKYFFQRASGPFSTEFQTRYMYM